jgi:hydroxymethylpyrimidine/phosphomethylpyrimidine kinase
LGVGITLCTAIALFIDTPDGTSLMREEQPQTPPVVLSVAGSDAGGGAGIQADIKTLAALGCFATTAITALTAQNTQGVQRVSPTEPGLVQDQIQSVAEDMPVAAVKTGMLANAAIIEATRDALAPAPAGAMVVDPVMVAKSGDPLIDDAAVETLARAILPLARVVTPNRGEVRRLLGHEDPLRSTNQAKAAAKQICERFGCAACIVKAVPQDAQMLDVLWDADHQQARIYSAAQHPTGHTHGSGCCFSAAIAGELAHGQRLTEAVERAKRFIDLAIANAPAVGQGARPVNPSAWSSASSTAERRQ